MSKLLLVSCFIVFVYGCGTSPETRSLIHSTSETLDIKDGDVLNKGSWRIDPTLNPDVYETSSHEVTFYTDIDSITFKIDPSKGDINFMVVLNNTDTAHTQIKYRLPYLSRLKKAVEYNHDDKRFVPEFTYQSAEDTNLIQLRKHYNLDSIAGKGSEINRIINLMYWVHNKVRHDGSSFNPSQKNAIDLIDTCQLMNRGVNCRMMATILNECYLSMGFESRYVTCMPKEKEFRDCHVINMVYAKDVKKWLWMDPTFAAYVMDEKGELLGLKEVRERLIEDQALILNPDANWNNTSTQTKAHYLEKYMAKNLYRLMVPVASRYNSETKGAYKKVEYLELLPLDGLEQTPQKILQQDKELDIDYIIYKTNNPDVFWKDPN